MKPEECFSMHGVQYVPCPDRGYTSVEVLQFLYGLTWNELALNWIDGLNPSLIRVSTGTLTCDSNPGRVTVFLDKENYIKKIEQEIVVGLRNCEDGHDLKQQTQFAPTKHDWMESRIPEGPYCYDGNGICPWWTRNNTKPEQDNGYCGYLQLGDWESKGLSLLWDQCKECGINDDVEND